MEKCRQHNKVENPPAKCLGLSGHPLPLIIYICFNLKGFVRKKYEELLTLFFINKKFIYRLFYIFFSI